MKVALRRSIHHPWLGFSLRIALGCGCGGAVMLALAAGVAAVMTDGLTSTLATTLAIAGMIALPIGGLGAGAAAFVMGGGRTLGREGEDVVLRAGQRELARAPLHSALQSARRGRFRSLGRGGYVFHFGLGPLALSVGVSGEPPASWPQAAPPELECSVADRDTLLALFRA